MFILPLCIYFFVEFCDAQWISHSACFVFHSKTGLKSIPPVPVDADVCVWRPWKPPLSRPTDRVSFSKKVLSIDWLVPFRFALVKLIDWLTRLIVRSIDLLIDWFHFASLCFGRLIDWLIGFIHLIDLLKLFLEKSIPQTEERQFLLRRVFYFFHHHFSDRCWEDEEMSFYNA